MARLTKCKTAIINLAFIPALKNIFQQLAQQPDTEELARWQNYIDETTFKWFSTKSAKKEVASLLNQFHLDETAIEAEAIIHVMDDIQRLDSLLAALGNRRDRALRRIAEYRVNFANRIRKAADQIIDAGQNADGGVVRLSRPRPRLSRN
jgi:hypothetical protein